MTHRMNDYRFQQWTEGWTRNDLTKLQIAHIKAAKAWDHALTANKVAHEFAGTMLGNSGKQLELDAFHYAVKATAQARRLVPKGHAFNVKELDHLLRLAESGLYTFYHIPGRAKRAYKRLRYFHVNYVHKTDDQKATDDLAWRLKWGIPPVGPPLPWKSKVDYLEGINPERFAVRRDENTKEYVLDDQLMGKEICRFEYLPVIWNVETIIKEYLYELGA